MNNIMTRTLAVISVACLLAGCNSRPVAPLKRPTAEQKAVSEVAKKDPEAEIQAALASLSPEDRKLAEAQRFCVVMTKSRLGSMDTPVKLMIEGEPVFICCAGCEKKVRVEPARTLATLKELRK